MPWMRSSRQCKHCARELRVLLIHADPPGGDAVIFRKSAPVHWCPYCDAKPAPHQGRIRDILGS